MEKNENEETLGPFNLSKFSAPLCSVTFLPRRMFFPSDSWRQATDLWLYIVPFLPPCLVFVKILGSTCIFSRPFLLPRCLSQLQKAHRAELLLPWFPDTVVNSLLPNNNPISFVLLPQLADMVSNLYLHQVIIKLQNVLHLERQVKTMCGCLPNYINFIWAVFAASFW